MTTESEAKRDVRMMAAFMLGLHKSIWLGLGDFDPKQPDLPLLLFTTHRHLLDALWAAHAEANKKEAQP